MRAAAAALVACIPLAVPSPAIGDDAAARGRLCDRALAEAGGTNLARAHLLLEDCLAADPGPRRAQVEAARARVAADLQTGSFAPVDVEVAPPGATVTVAAFAGDTFVAPRSVWLPFGTHEIRATAAGHQGGSVTVSISSRAPGPPLKLALLAEVPPPPGEHEVDFADEGAAGDVESSSDLPAAEHDELLKDKYRRGLAARGDAQGAAAPRRVRTGFRFGVGFW